MNTNTDSVVSRQYTLAFLASNPASKGIIKKHLGNMFDEAQKVHASPRELFETNMGGGISYNTLITLMKDLDKLTI